MKRIQVNLNGTSHSDLLKQARDALQTIETAIDTARKVTLHGRDYQTVVEATEAHSEDKAEYLAAMSKLRDAQDYFKECALHIYSQR